MRQFNVSADDLARYFAANLTNWMRLTGYNSKTLAEMLDITPSMTSYILTGVKKPGLEMVARVINATGMTPGELFACPEFIASDGDPLEMIHSIAETSARLGSQIRVLYDRVKHDSGDVS